MKCRSHCEYFPWGPFSNSNKDWITPFPTAVFVSINYLMKQIRLIVSATKRFRTWEAVDEWTSVTVWVNVNNGIHLHVNCANYKWQNNKQKLLIDNLMFHNWVAFPLDIYNLSITHDVYVVTQGIKINSIKFYIQIKLSYKTCSRHQRG